MVCSRRFCSFISRLLLSLVGFLQYLHQSTGCACFAAAALCVLVDQFHSMYESVHTCAWNAIVRTGTVLDTVSTPDLHERSWSR